MFLGRVIGTVWATRKDSRIDGMKLQVVQHLDMKLAPLSPYVVAVDAVGAGVGEVVLVAQGSSARQTTATHNRPVDAVIMAIVDNMDLSEPARLEEELRERAAPILERLERQPVVRTGD
ncbi:MAG: EutN/CcmL family microcompartment protein [Planctomycetes bacterium]|nr:EutN/CcmL family microcompartment protein [Planctomycetota bacterium]